MCMGYIVVLMCQIERMHMILNHRVIGFNALAVKVLLGDFPWWVAGKKVVGSMFVCMSVCPSIFASGAQTAGPIETGEYRFMRRSDGKTMVLVADRSVARGRCHVQSGKDQSERTAGQTIGRIRLKLGGPNATIGGHVSLG